MCWAPSPQAGQSLCTECSDGPWGSNTVGLVKDRGYGDFPGGPVAKTPCSQCKGPEFNSWSGNQIPHATGKIPHAVIKAWLSQFKKKG